MATKAKNIKPWNTNPAREWTRPTPTRADYGPLHQALRAQLLAEFPLCQICGKNFSEHAHHLVYPATCLAHYQALCESCHAAAHR